MSSDTFDSRQLHPVGVLILGLGGLREAGLPVLVIGALSVAEGGVETSDFLVTIGFAAFAAVLAAAAGAFAWMTTKFSLSPEALSFETGWLSTKETTIPLERVQSLDEVVGPLHRLFRVVRVDVQTAGGEAGGEISLAAVGPDVVATLRRAVAARGGLALEAEARGPVRRLGRGALLAAALTSGRLGVLLPVVAFVPQVLDELFFPSSGNGDRETDPGALLGLAPDSAAEWLTVGAVLLGAAWALSALGVLVAFAGFEAERASDRLLIRRGLLQRRLATVPISRVQAVRVVEGVLRQPFRLASVRVEVAGYAEEDAAAQTLFPLLRRDEVPDLLRTLLPELAGEVGPLRPAPARALRRYVLPRVLVALAAGTGVWLAAGTPAALALAVPAAVAGLLAHRAAGCSIRDGRVAVRFRRLARTTLLGPARLTQGHSVRQSPLQRRAKLADFEITLGADGRGRVRHLEAADAWAAWHAATAG
jgi:putative membrane protein